MSSHTGLPTHIKEKKAENYYQNTTKMGFLAAIEPMKRALFRA